jgi:hypothetical protein
LGVVPTQIRLDLIPDASTADKAAKLDKTNMQYRLFAQFFKEDADMKLDESNRTLRAHSTMETTARFNA